MDLMVPRSYNKKKQPIPLTGPPLMVNVDIDVWCVASVKEDRMKIEAELILKFEWEDSRFVIPHEVRNSTQRYALNERVMEKMWIPLLIFRNCRACGLLDLYPKNHKMFLQTGRVINRFKLDEEFLCNFDLHSYPLDVQMCQLQLQNAFISYKEMMLIQQKSTKQILSKNLLAHFRVVSIRPSNCSLNEQEELQQGFVPSCIQLVVTLQRRLTHSVMHTFIPSSLVVVLSWMTFWIDIEAVPARAGLGVTCFLTLATSFSSQQEHLPQVSYLKALDVWTLYCIINVFATLIEFTSASFVHRQRLPDKPRQIKPAKVFLVKEVKPVNQVKKTISVSTNRVDKISRVVFPSIFLLFNIVYWSVYLPSYNSVDA